MKLRDLLGWVLVVWSWFAKSVWCVSTLYRGCNLEQDLEIIEHLIEHLSSVPCLDRYQICSIPGRSSRSDREEFHGVKLHRLPQDPVLRHKWLISIKKPISVSENTRICSLHFEGSERTADCAVPTIFAWSVAVKHRQPPAIRNPVPCKKQKHKEPSSPAEVAREEVKKHEEQIAQL